MIITIIIIIIIRAPNASANGPARVPGTPRGPTRLQAAP